MGTFQHQSTGSAEMKILFLSFYYYPDLCAGSFRATPLANELSTQLPENSEIRVITTLPNRYSSFSSDAPQHEEVGNLTITRVSLPPHKSGMLDQSKAFMKYAQAVLRETKGQRFDIVIATSSRLMTATLGAYIARRKGSKLYLDIRDIFVDTIKDVLSKRFSGLAKFLFSKFENYAIRSADKVNLVSAGFLPYFQERYPHSIYSVITNGIDDEFIKSAPHSIDVQPKEIYEVLYAGNMGEGQGLHQIIPALAKRFHGKLRFTLIGDGGRRPQLESAIKQSNCTNVELRPPIKREELIKAYQEADILFLHLNNYDAFLKVLPSKIFEYAALGKPLWAGVSGYSAKFLNDHVSNVAVFNPCDAQHAASAFSKLELRTIARTDFIDKFSRSTLTKQLASDILELADSQNLCESY